MNYKENERKERSYLPGDKKMTYLNENGNEISKDAYINDVYEQFDAMFLKSKIEKAIDYVTEHFGQMSSDEMVYMIDEYNVMYSIKF